MSEVKTGRPTKYRPEMDEQAMKLCLLGATNEQIANFFGVAVATIHNWMDANPSFLDAITRGKVIADAEVASSLYNRALGYKHKAVKIMVVDKEVVHEEYTEHYPPDTQAASLWLRNRQPALWRDKTEVGVTDKDGNDVVSLAPEEVARRVAFLFAQADADRPEGTVIQ